MKRRLTAAAVEKVRPPATGQTDVFDSGFPGLCLRVSYGGTKAWSAFLRVNHKQRRIALGSYPAMTLAEAREAWRDAIKLAATGRDPVRPASDDVAAVIAEWLKRDQAKNRSYADVKRSIDCDVLPKWQGRKIGEISRHDCLLLIDAVADRGSVIMARRLYAYLHRFFRWSVGRGIIPVNPIADAPKPGEENSRERVLTDAELKAVWKTASKIGWPFGSIIQLLILTGARRSEIGQLRWDEIVGDEIQLSGDRTKTDQPHIIPLSPHAVGILAKVPRILNSPFVFSLNGKTPVQGWSKDKARLDKECGVTDWRIHDLRRTCATGLQKLGVSLQVVEAILGHTSGSRRGIVGIYQRHDFADEKKSALALWAQHVANL